MSPSLSIVTPSFNQGRFLPRCLASVRDQPPGVAEHIVIDGGSTDGSRSLLEGCAPTFAFWRSEPDGGQSDAINEGFARASAVFGGWLNADDWYQPGLLGPVAAFLRDHPETDLLVCRCRFVAEDGRVVHAPIPPERIDEPSLLSLASQWFAGHSIAQPETFFRLSMYREIGGLRPDNHHSMDHELWLRFLEAGARVRQLDLHVANLAVHAQQKTADRLATTSSIVAHSRAWLDRRGMLWPRHEPEIRAEIDTLQTKLTHATRYVRVLDRALGAQRSTPWPGATGSSDEGAGAGSGASRAAEIRTPSPTPKGWAEACRQCLASVPTDLKSAVLVCAPPDRQTLRQIVQSVRPGLAIREVDPAAVDADPGVTRAAHAPSLLILHRALGRARDLAGSLGTLLVGPGGHACVLVSSEPEDSPAHRHYLARLRTRAINKVTQPDTLLLAPHADPHLLPLIATDESPLLAEPNPCGVRVDELVAGCTPRFTCRASVRFGRADFLPSAPFPTLPKLMPRIDGQPADFWRTTLFVRDPGG